MKWYNPISWFKREKMEVEEKPEISEKVRKKLEETVKETRKLLEYAASARCSMYGKEYRHFRLRVYSSLNKKQ